MYEYTPNAKENYKIALEHIKGAERSIYALYCVPKPPEERPNTELEFLDYFNEINEILNRGDIEYNWLLGIYGIETLESLLNKIKMFLDNEASKKMIIKGLTKIRIIDLIGNRNFVPINFQVVDGKNVVMGYPTISEVRGVEEGVAIRDEAIATSFLRYFRCLWGNAEPIVEGGVRLENSIRTDNINKLLEKVEANRDVMAKFGLIKHRITGNAILFDVPEELVDSFSKIRNVVSECFDIVKHRFLYYAPHDENHIKRVSDTYLWKIFYEDEQIFELGPIERYLLSVSAYCHDLGMGIDDSSILELIKEKVYRNFHRLLKIQKEEMIDELDELANKLELKDKDNDVVNKIIRKYHALLGGCYIIRNWHKIGIKNYEYAKILADMVVAHSSRTDINELSKTEKVGNQVVYERFLSAILRLADALDLEYRANVEAFAWKRIYYNEPDQTRHWAYKLIIRGVSIVDNCICLFHDAANEDEFNCLKAFEGLNLAEELNEVRDVLREGHDRIQLNIHSVKIKKLNGENDFENLNENINDLRDLRNELEEGKIDEIAKKIVDRLKNMGIIPW